METLASKTTGKGRQTSVNDFITNLAPWVLQAIEVHWGQGSILGKTFTGAYVQAQEVA